MATIRIKFPVNFILTRILNQAKDHQQPFTVEIDAGRLERAMRVAKSPEDMRMRLEDLIDDYLFQAIRTDTFRSVFNDDSVIWEKPQVVDLDWNINPDKAYDLKAIAGDPDLAPLLPQELKDLLDQLPALSAAEKHMQQAWQLLESSRQSLEG